MENGKGKARELDANSDHDEIARCERKSTYSTPLLYGVLYGVEYSVSTYTINPP
jgi:hypothetical protein